MSDTKQHIKLITSQKHRDNIEKLNIPDEVIPYLSFQVINLLAEKVSSLTNQQFMYYGDLSVDGENTLIKLTSTKGNELITTISHDLVYEESDSDSGDNIIFDNINKLLDEKFERKQVFNKMNRLIDEQLESVTDDKDDETETIQEHVETPKEKVESANISKDNLSRILENINNSDINEKKEVDLQKSQEKQKINSFLSALENIKSTEDKDIKKKKKTFYLEQLNKKLNSEIDKGKKDEEGS